MGPMPTATYGPGVGVVSDTLYVAGGLDTSGNNINVLQAGTPIAAQVQQPINADGSSVFKATRGVVPVQFALTLGGVATCTLPNATISLTRTAGGTIGSIDETVFVMARIAARISASLVANTSTTSDRSHLVRALIGLT